MNKTVLITGCNKGLGLSLTKLYLEKNYIVFSGVKNKPSKEIAELKEQYKEKLNIIIMDISKDASVEEAAKEVFGVTDSLDILINNAGVHFDETYSALEEINFDIALKTLNINSLGPLRVAKEFLSAVKKGDTKVIVNISSEAGSIGQCGRDREFEYCMSKAALNMESVLLQNYVKSDGIKVLSVHPGWMKTDMGGPNAAIEAEVAAEGVFKLVEKYKGDLSSPIYMDYTGKIFEW